MLFNEIIATSTGEVGISWFDFYSIGHICFGIGAFLLISLFYTIPKAKGYTPIFSLLLVFILSMITFVVWEIIENYVLLWLGLENLKFEGRVDSLQNMTTDILLGGVGALGAWLFAYMTFEKDRKIWPYYTFGLISLSLWLGVFIILRYLTIT
ncbi:MAG: hypothetical protein ACFE9R_20235 [Candidatus Hermodarchaeota archaeon]